MERWAPCRVCINALDLLWMGSMLHARAGVPPSSLGIKGSLVLLPDDEILAARRSIHSKRQLSSQGLYVAPCETRYHVADNTLVTE